VGPPVGPYLFRARIACARETVAIAEIDALLIALGSDLRLQQLIGYAGLKLHRHCYYRPSWAASDRL